MSLSIRPATPADVPLILALIRELADYERAPDAVAGHRTRLARAAVLLVAEDIFRHRGMGMASPRASASGSTTSPHGRGRLGIYLEDLFVRPAYRGHGIGKALMALLASRCIAQGLERMDWAVLEWNELALEVYRGVGAEVLHDWRMCRLSVRS